jgi:hypothetical protein
VTIKNSGGGVKFCFGFFTVIFSAGTDTGGAGMVANFANGIEDWENPGSRRQGGGGGEPR